MRRSRLDSRPTAAAVWVASWFAAVGHTIGLDGSWAVRDVRNNFVFFVAYPQKVTPMYLSSSQPAPALWESSRQGSAPRAWSLAFTIVLCSAAAACNEDDGEPPVTVPLADSASLTPLTEGGLEIPTTVAVSLGVAWIAESQFNHYEPFGGAGMPGPFRLVGVPFNGDPLEFIALPPGFFPEGVTSSSNGRLYVGSVAGGGIVTVDEDNFDAIPFISGADIGGGVFGITLSSDQRQTMLWACTNADGAARVVGVDIATASAVVRHALPAAGEVAPFCNDLVMSPDGALWVTESMGGRLFRIASENLMTQDSAEVWLDAPNLRGPDPGDFGANGIALVGGQLYVANTDRGSLWRIDPALPEPTPDDLKRVSLSLDGADTQLVRPDGITALGSDALLIVENGFQVEGGKRLLRATFDPL